MTAQTQKDPVAPLVALGFSELEAIVYTYLVGNSPATGYRVAHDIDKPIANTYKAIESLHQMGAVMVDSSGENRQVRAVAPRELLEQLAESFNDRHEAAARALQQLEPSDRDVGVYSLTQAEQVLSRARDMIRRAESVVLCDLFPRALGELRGELEEAGKRGVTVVVKTYEPASVKHAQLVESSRGSELREEWPGTWMNVVVDETELLLALLDKNSPEVRQAVWSGSPFLAVVYHIAFSWEITGSRIEGALREETGLDRIRELVADFQRIESPEAPGYKEIVGQNVRSSDSTGAKLLGDD